MDRRRVGILVFPEVEVLDFCGPFEVFSVTRLDEDRRRIDPSPYEVHVIAEHHGVIVGHKSRQRQYGARRLKPRPD